MKTFLIKAYADAEYGLIEQRRTIRSENHESAKLEAGHMFPEYHQIGVFELEGE